MSAIAPQNLGFIACWNEILTPKWVRFRHLLSGNGQIHSDIAAPLFDIREGERVLDIGCGFGETCLQHAATVGAGGEVLGVDCTDSFLEIAERERRQAGADNVRYELGDAQEHPLPAGHFDVAYARFGVMFFQSAVRALRNMHGALKQGGRVCLIVWRTLSDNVAWNAAREVALRHLPPPGDDLDTCGPGPFSMGHEPTTRDKLAAGHFPEVERFELIEADICVGRDLEEAIDYQLLVGPAGEIIREAGELGRQKLPIVRAEVRELLEGFVRDDGSVFMPSSSWAIVARKAS